MDSAGTLSKLTRQLSWQEASGALGDLGTFLPLIVALVPAIQLDFGTTLIITGCYNILSGLAFGIPMCVQPMKTIAAVALTSAGMTMAEVVGAGVFVSACVLLLGVTRVIDIFNAWVPLSIVRGIQLAVGLTLAEKGLRQALMVQGPIGPGAPYPWRPWGGLDGLALGIIGLLGLLLTAFASFPRSPAATSAAPATIAAAGCGGGSSEARECDVDSQRGQQQQHYHQQQQEDGSQINNDHQRLHHQSYQQQQQQKRRSADQGRSSEHYTASAPIPAAGPAGGCDLGCKGSSRESVVPSALVVVVLGLLLVLLLEPKAWSGLKFGPNIPQLMVPTWQEFLSGVRKAGIAQLPLTTLNSVVAVTQLANQLFPQRADAEGWRWQPSAVAMSVGGMNLLGVWLGAFPCCHGSGGLAAQYKFGARHGAAPVLLGVLKLLLGLLFGSSLFHLLQYFPKPLLGSMLLISGLELAGSVKKQDEEGFAYMLLTAIASIVFKDVSWGFAMGIGVYVLSKAATWTWQVFSSWLARRPQYAYSLVATVEGDC